MKNNEEFFRQKALYNEDEHNPIKTPLDFKGDVFQGVQAFQNLNSNLRKYLPVVLCKVHGQERKCKCEIEDLKGELK